MLGKMAKWNNDDVFASHDSLYCIIERILQPNGSGVPRNFVRGGSTNSVEDRWQRERGSGGGSTLVRGSGGSCKLVQEMSFHTVTFSSFLVLQSIYDDNQFICHC